MKEIHRGLLDSQQPCLAQEVLSDSDFHLSQNAKIQDNGKHEQQDCMRRCLGINLFKI